MKPGTLASDIILEAFSMSPDLHCLSASANDVNTDLSVFKNLLCVDVTLAFGGWLGEHAGAGGGSDDERQESEGRQDR